MRRTVLGILSLLLLAACGGPPSAAQNFCSASTCGWVRQSPRQPTVEVARQTSFGDVLVSNRGYTLYGVSSDGPDRSRCAGRCADRWPPLVEEGGSPQAGSGLDQGALGTIPRAGGVHQITYRGIPLYTYSMDQAPGQTNGELVRDQGIWYVVRTTTTSPSTGLGG